MSTRHAQGTADIPPMALDAERAVLGALLLEGSGAMLHVVGALQPEDFYTEAHRVVYHSMLRLHGRGEPVDVLMLQEDLRRAGELERAGGPATLALFLEQAQISVNLPSYVTLVTEASRRREYMALGERLRAGGMNGASAADLSAWTAELQAVHRARDARRRPDEAPTLTIIGMGAFIAQAFPEPVPLIEGILSDDGGGWLGGEEKTNKTWWMEAEATSLALAKPLAGRFAVPRRRRALILEEEDSPRRTHRRIRAVLRGHGVDPDDPAIQADLDAWLRVSVWSGFTLDNPLLVAQLDAALADFRPAVCYIDCLRKVTLRDLNKANEASALLAILDDFRRRYSVVFRLVHHFRKQQGFRTGRGSQEIGGSFVLGAWSENSLFFEPIGRKQGAVRVEIQSKDGAPVPGFTLKIESEGPSHALDLVRLVAQEDADPHDADELVFQAVATLPKQEAVKGEPGVSVKALAGALKRVDKTIRRSLDRLCVDERCLVTGSMSKGAKLYVVNGQ